MGRSNAWKESNDKPDFNFGIQGVDDSSIRRAIMSVVPLMPRHLIFMEVKQNLVAQDRKDNLKRFSLPHFKRVAHVVMGEPSKEYQERVQGKLLDEKQAKLDNDWKIQKIEKERKKAMEERQRLVAEQQKKAAEGDAA